MSCGLGLVFVIVGHIVADFYVQTNAMAEKKSNGVGFLALHCMLYGACLALFAAFVVSPEQVLVAGAVFCVTHAVSDAVKIAFEKRGIMSGFSRFSTDQAFHLFVCFAVVLGLGGNGSGAALFLRVQETMGHDAFAQALVAAASFLASWRPASVFVQQLLSSIHKDKRGKRERSGNESEEEQRAGRWIGILERTIVVVLTLYGQFGAIAFVLTAKSIARFNKLSEDKDFAERYLVGTLASAAVAILVTLFFQNMAAW